MAQSEHLPIYKSTYDLCLYLEQVVHNFARYHKYTLGTDLRDGARRVLKLVVRANARRDKVPVLLELREELEELKVLLRLGQDVKAFANFKSFEHAITQVVEIAKQINVGCALRTVLLRAGIEQVLSRSWLCRLPCVVVIPVPPTYRPRLKGAGAWDAPYGERVGFM